MVCSNGTRAPWTEATPHEPAPLAAGSRTSPSGVLGVTRGQSQAKRRVKPNPARTENQRACRQRRTLSIPASPAHSKNESRRLAQTSVPSARQWRRHRDSFTVSHASGQILVVSTRGQDHCLPKRSHGLVRVIISWRGSLGVASCFSSPLITSRRHSQNGESLEAPIFRSARLLHTSGGPEHQLGFGALESRLSSVHSNP